MTSILAETNPHKDLLTDNEWLADNGFGKEVEIDVGQVKGHSGKNTVRIEPFTFLRHWNDTWPDSFELVQSFILFYNLHFDVSGNKYVAVDGAGETTDVVRIKDEEQYEKIEIRGSLENTVDADLLHI